MRKNGITIAEVAKLAGVSASTVSRVTRGFSKITPETRKRVEQIIQDHHFIPEKRTNSNIQKGKLKHGKVLFLVPDTKRSAAMSRIALELAQGADDVLSKLKIELIIRGLEPDGSLPSIIQSGRVDGIICKNWPDDPRIVEQLKQLPHTWCLSIPLSSGIGDQACCDHSKLAQLAINHFKKNGITDVRLFSNSNQLSEVERKNELRKHAVEAGLRFNVITKYENFKLPAGKEIKYGIVIENSDILLPFIHMQLINMGIRQGDNAEIICLNSLPGQTEPLDPSLRRMEFNTYEIGKAAASLLIWRIENPDSLNRRLLIEPTLMETN